MGLVSQLSKWALNLKLFFFLGVLTQGQLDNGRGRARLNMFRHLHEIQTGRTSSISHEILGFDSEGHSVDYSTCNTAEEICENATKLLTFIDLAGISIFGSFFKPLLLNGYAKEF